MGVPDFARGPDSTSDVKVPNNTSAGIPITLTNPGNSSLSVSTATFELSYNPALLYISGTQSSVAGSSFSLTSNNAEGLVSFTFQSGTAVTVNAGGTVTLGQILAQVPNSAATNYKTKALLHLSDIAVINSAGGSISAENNDGLQVAAYLGDVSGDGVYSPLDAALISRVAVAFDTGFAAYPMLDPSIIGNPTGNGIVNSGDVTLLNRAVAGYPQTKMPVIPNGLSIVPTGPDPILSVPTDLVVAPDGTVVVPVDIDTARPPGSSGMMQAMIALRYDPRLFTVAAADVQLGSVPLAGSGWQLTTSINAQTGEIGIDLFSTTPIDSQAGGSLVTIEMHVDRGPWTVDRVEGAVGSGPMFSQPAFALVNQVNPTGRQVFTTEAADAQGAFVLHWATDDATVATASSQLSVAAAGNRIAAGSSLHRFGTMVVAASRARFLSKCHLSNAGD